MSGTPTPVRYRHVLLATDLTQVSAPALASGHALAERLGARLTTIAVRPSWQRSGVPASSGGVGAAPYLPAVTVLEGIPGIEIVRFAESVMADLILMVRPGPGESPLPAMADHHDPVVRRADVPCLVLPSGQLRFGRMRVALDGSERGMKALRVAWSLKKLSEDGVSAVYVGQEPEGAAPSTTRLRLQGWIREVVRPVTPPPLVEAAGDVVQGVLAGLSAQRGDLLVLGVRRGGPSGVDESTGAGRRILAAARCAVLTVPL